MASTTDGLTLEYRGKIAIITIDRPKKLGALSGPDYYYLALLLKEINQRVEVVVTVIVGKGRFFSAGADVSSVRPSGDDHVSVRELYMRGFAANNLEVTQAFATHSKILVFALNGPAVGLSAAVTGYADFIYAAPHAFLLTPFTSLGLVAEGGASMTFIERLGVSKANEALIMSKRITCPELVACGYVNKVIEGVDSKDETGKFLEKVLQEVDDRLLAGHLSESSMLAMKALIRRPGRTSHESQLVAELLGGVQRFVEGHPQREFARIASGEKKHKL